MNNLEELDDWILRYNEGTLTDKEQESFRKILEKDPEIRTRVALDLEITKFLQDKDLLRFRDFIDKNKPRQPGSGLRNWTLLAALMLTFLVVGSWLVLIPWRNHLIRPPYWLGSQIPDSSPVLTKPRIHPFSIRTSPGFPVIQPDTIQPLLLLLAENFSPLPWMEGLVGETTRHAGLRVLSPRFSISIAQGDTLRFRWISPASAELELVITDNKGSAIWRKADLSVDSCLVPTDVFSPGLYYWKLLMDQELGFVGKVKVVR